MSPQHINPVFKKQWGQFGPASRPNGAAHPAKGLFCILPVIWGNEATYPLWEAASVTGGYERVSPWPSLLGSVAVLITYFVCARTRRHLGDCWLAGQSRGVKADTEVKVKNFLYVGQVSSQNPHFIHLLGWCNVHLGIRHDIILLLPFLYSFMFLPPFNSTISFCLHKDSLARQAASKRRKHREIKQMT